MVYTELTKKAALICESAHHGQLDKAGFPYCMHPIHLAEQMDDELTCCVALLHDVTEDCPAFPLEKLEQEGFPKEVLAALRLLTHDKDVPYMEYVSKIGENPIAKKVKIADLRHNLDVTRGAGIPKKYELYKEALAYLEQKEQP